MFLILTSLFLGFIFLAYFFQKYRFNYWQRRGVPGPSISECMGAFRRTLHKTDEEFARKYGPVYGAYVILQPILTVNDADLVKEIIKDFSKFPDHMHFNFGNGPINGNLFSLPGNDDWKRIRSVMSPVFTSGKLRKMMDSMSELTDNLVENIKPKAGTGQMIDMKLHISAFVMDIIATCAYGVKIDSINNKDHPIVVNAKKAFGFDAKLSAFICFAFPKIAKLLDLWLMDKGACQFFDALTVRLINERQRQSDAQKRSDFLQLMVNAIKEEGSNKSMTMDEVVAQGMLFFLAGYDSSAAAMSHCLYYLAKNSECQEKLYKELKALEDINQESFNEIKYLDAVINETLRLSPPFLRFSRQAAEDGVLGKTGIRYKKGMVIQTLTHVLHRDPRYWAEPNEFKPERFLKPEHHQYAFIPFGHGPRNCIGMRFAMNEMRMCIAKLVVNFRFRLPPTHTELEYFTGNGINTPKNVYVWAEKR